MYVCIYYWTQRYPDVRKDNAGVSAAVEEVAVGTSTTKLQYQMVGMCYCLLLHHHAVQLV